MGGVWLGSEFAFCPALGVVALPSILPCFSERGLQSFFFFFPEGAWKTSQCSEIEETV